MCKTCQEQQERDARFWRAMRRALLAAVKAIEARYPDRQDQRAA